MAKGRVIGKIGLDLSSVDEVEAMERALVLKRREAARQLRGARRATKLSLRQVSAKVRISAPAIHNTERAKAWQTKTARKLALFYSEALSGSEEVSKAA